MTGNATTILTKAVQYDQIGRKLEAFTLYEDGIRALLETCKSKSKAIQLKTGIIISK